MMKQSTTGGTAPEDITFLLNRQIRYLDFLDKELDRVTTGSEAEAVVSMLEATKRTVAGLEARFMAVRGTESW